MLSDHPLSQSGDNDIINCNYHAATAFQAIEYVSVVDEFFMYA